MPHKLSNAIRGTVGLIPTLITININWLDGGMVDATEKICKAKYSQEDEFGAADIILLVVNKP